MNSKLNEALEMTEQSLHLSEMGRLRKDQEDLMELLTDQVQYSASSASSYESKSEISLRFLSFALGVENQQIPCKADRTGAFCNGR